jgi:hypothetical protein
MSAFAIGVFGMLSSRKDASTIHAPETFSRFTNGLTAYLTGDTGLHAEMQTVERDFYKVNLMELNFGQSARTPETAAHAVNTPVQCVAGC